MSLSEWFSLSLICLLGAMSPGPSLAMVTKHSLAGGRLNGLAAAWAHSFGIALYAFFTIIGLSLVLHKAEWLFKGISLAGAFYLAYLGWKSLRSEGGVLAKLNEGRSVSFWQSAKEGLLISLLNPKIALFFMALFSQFISLGHDWESRSLLIFTPSIIDGVWYSIITLLLSSSSVTEKLRSKAKVIDRLSGIVLLGLAVRVVATL